MLCLCAFIAKAQANLQFNQVIYLKYSYVLPNSNSYQKADYTITVPAGKVWKIESAVASSQNSGSNYVSPTSTLVLDGVNLTFYASGSGAYKDAPLPIWLPAGTYDVTLVTSASTSAGAITSGRISAIEFNVAP